MIQALHVAEALKIYDNDKWLGLSISSHSNYLLFPGKWYLRMLKSLENIYSFS